MASTPRRSLIKYGKPQRALELAVVADASLGRHCEAMKPAAPLLGEVASDPEVIEEAVQADLDEIHSWRGRPLAEVMERFEALVNTAVGSG